MRKRLAETKGEGQALMYLLVACLLFYVAQIPEMVRADLLSTSTAPFNGVAAGRFMGGAILAPLFFYVLSALMGLACRLAGFKTPWFQMRVALFWSLLASAPAMLSLGMIRGLTPAPAVLWPISALVAIVFLVFWAIGIFEAISKWR